MNEPRVSLLSIVLMSSFFCYADANTGAWFEEDFPDPQLNPADCGRDAPSYVCDPNNMISASDESDLDSNITFIRANTTSECQTGYQIAIAFFHRFNYTGLDLPPFEVHDSFAEYLRKTSWSYGGCGEDAVIIITNDTIVVSLGSVLEEKLGGCIEEIVQEAYYPYLRYIPPYSGYYVENDDYAGAATYILTQFRLAFDGELSFCEQVNDFIQFLMYIIYVAGAILVLVILGFIVKYCAGVIC